MLGHNQDNDPIHEPQENEDNANHSAALGLNAIASHSCRVSLAWNIIPELAARYKAIATMKIRMKQHIQQYNSPPLPSLEQTTHPPPHSDWNPLTHSTY